MENKQNWELVANKEAALDFWRVLAMVGMGRVLTVVCKKI